MPFINPITVTIPPERRRAVVRALAQFIVAETASIQRRVRDGRTESITLAREADLAYLKTLAETVAGTGRRRAR